MLSGALQALIFAPTGAWWLSPVVLVPALCALKAFRGKRAFFAGWLTGTSAGVAVAYWIVPTLMDFGGLPWTVAALALLAYGTAFGVFTGIFALGLAPLERVTQVYWPVAAAGWWVSCEFLNPQLFVHILGLAFSEQRALLLSTAITGIWGVSFQIVLWNATLAQSFWQRAVPWPSVSVAASLLFLSVTYSLHRDHTIQAEQAKAPVHRIALLQDNLGPHARAALLRRGPAAIPEALVAMSRKALERDPTIEAMVWAEGALPGTPRGKRTESVRRLASEHSIELWTGGYAFRGLRRYNAAFRVRGDGSVDPPYHKNILVPFGEYLPFREQIPMLKTLWGSKRHEPGDSQVVFDTTLGHVSFVICYEATKSPYVRSTVGKGIDLLVNPTYDGWFGDTACPYQHLAAAALQSAQFGVPLVRASSTGISAFIDARGTITARAPLLRPAVLVADVPVVTQPSLYAAWGDWFAWSCVGGSVLLGVFSLWARPRQVKQRAEFEPTENGENKQWRQRFRSRKV